MCNSCNTGNFASREYDPRPITGTVYKVTYFDHGHRKVSGGHTYQSACDTAERIKQRVGVRDVEVVRTGETFKMPNHDIL